MQEDFAAAARWLKSLPDSTGKLGAVGFCFGGGVVNQLAVRLGSDLDAAVPFYGLQPDAADAQKIKAPILAQYGELDQRITSGWPAFDAALSTRAFRMRVISIRARTTASTTTRRRATIRRRPKKPGSGRSTG